MIEQLTEIQNLSGLGEKFERQLAIQKQFAEKMKLIDLLTESEILCNDCGQHGNSYCIEAIADHLIANGVTFAKDTNVLAKNVGKWIPVAEKLPDTIPCGAGTEYSEAVNVLTSGRKVLTAIFDGNDFIADAEFWEAENEEITHWTPVLLPLPESPKGERVQ